MHRGGFGMPNPYGVRVVLLDGGAERDVGAAIGATFLVSGVWASEILGVSSPVNEGFVAIDLKLERPICTVIGNGCIGGGYPAGTTSDNTSSHKRGKVICDGCVMKLEEGVISDCNASADPSSEIVVFGDSGVESAVIGEDRIVDLNIPFA